MTCTNDGTFETRPLITVTGPIVDPSVVNAVTAQAITFTGLNLGASDQLVISTDARQSYVNGQFTAADVSSAWWSLTPGDTQVYLTGGNYAGGATVTCQWASRGRRRGCPWPLAPPAECPWILTAPRSTLASRSAPTTSADRAINVGTAAAVQVPGGVYPGLGAMQVTPASGLSVQVAAGYCCVPSPTVGQGGYIFGTLTAQTLNLAAADPANARIDLVVAYVNDTGSSAGGCGIAVVTGTPATPPTAPSPSSTPVASTAVLVLAQVTVPPAAVALASGAITDQRSWVVAPGGVLPISGPTAAPAAPATQLFYDLSRNLLCRGTGTAGTVALLTGGAWTPALVYKTSAVNDSAAKARSRRCCQRR